MKRQGHLVVVGLSLVATVLLAGCSSSTTYTSTHSSATYTPMEAVQHDDVVVGPSGKISNLPIFTCFLDHLANHKSDMIQITSYTTEGDPIFIDLSYDGNVIRYVYDNSNDQFGGQKRGRTTTTCVSVSSRHVPNGTIYEVVGSKNTNLPTQILFVPSSQH